MRQLWSDPVLRLLAGLVFLGFGVFIAMTTWAETLLKPGGVHSATTDTLLTVMVLTGIVGCAVIPPVGAARHIQPQIIAISTVTITACCILLAAAPGVTGAAIALPILGLLLLPDLPLVLELAERRAGSAGGTATAILWMAGNAGGIVFALIIQGLQNAPAAAFGTMAGGGLVAFPLCFALAAKLKGPTLTEDADGERAASEIPS
jgi:fucose permease